MNEFAILILAAGASKRLGTAKQLLEFGGKTLLQHAIDEANQSLATVVTIVTGSQAMEVERSIRPGSATVVFNPEWAKGMGTGISAGVRDITSRYPDVSAIIVSVCDQPFISAAQFNGLIASYRESGKNLVASAYNGTLGTPVLFSAAHFPALLALQAEEGARQLVRSNTGNLAIIPFANGGIDIDTPVDYTSLLNHANNS